MSEWASANEYAPERKGRTATEGGQAHMAPKTSAAACWTFLILALLSLAAVAALSGAGYQRLLLPASAAGAFCGLGALIAFAIYYVHSRAEYRNAVKKTFKLSRMTGKLINEFIGYFDRSASLLQKIFENGEGTAGGDGQTAMRRETENLTGGMILRTERIKNTAGWSKAAAECLLVERPDVYSTVDEIIASGARVSALLAEFDTWLPDDASVRLDDINKRIQAVELVNRIIISGDFYLNFIREFVTAVIRDLSRSSHPLSEEILSIKKSVTRFVNSIAQWKKDLTDEESPLCFTNLIGYYNDQNNKFNTLLHTVDSNYTRVQKRLHDALSVVAEIGKQSSQVQRIAENVNVLSINASIEAARAGESGKGFKVIADEIKELSEMTHRIIGAMVGLMEQIRHQVEETVKEFINDGEKITIGIRGQQDEFEVFCTYLKTFSNNFDRIFSLASVLVKDIDIHVTQFNPLFQLHELLVQEMENLKKYITEFVYEQQKKTNNAGIVFVDELQRRSVKELIKKLDEKTISRFEIEVLGKIMSLYQYKKEEKEPKTGCDIEIFASTP